MNYFAITKHVVIDSMNFGKGVVIFMLGTVMEEFLEGYQFFYIVLLGYQLFCQFLMGHQNFE